MTNCQFNEKKMLFNVLNVGNVFWLLPLHKFIHQSQNLGSNTGSNPFASV